MQLVAYGAQDVYLTGNPQITFFKVVYKRHTNFSIEPITVTFNGNVGFGRRSQVQIIRSGDLITKIYLQVDLPAVFANSNLSATELAKTQFAWCTRVGHALIDYIELDIGGSRIDKQYGVWFTIWEELTLPVSQQRGYAEMIGNTPLLTELSSPAAGTLQLKPRERLYIPLQFWFNRNNGLALPLIALQYHEVRLTFQFRAVNECTVHSTNFVPKNNVTDLENGILLVDYVYLDTEERRRFAQVSHEYLIEQLQFNDNDAVTSNVIKEQLNFNHPSKALFWIIRSGLFRNDRTFLAYDSVDWNAALKTAAEKLLIGLYAMNADGSLITDCDQTNGNYMETCVLVVDKNTGALVDNGESVTVCILDLDVVKSYVVLPDGVDLYSLVSGNIVVYRENGLLYVHHVNLVNNNLSMFELSVNVENYTVDNRNLYVVSLDLVVWQQDNFGLYLDGTGNPVRFAKIQFNGHDRFDPLDGRYFNYVQPYECWPNTPDDGLNTYSFALKPAEHQPSGTANFSRIDTTDLYLTLQQIDPSTGKDVYRQLLDPETKLAVFTVNYNILRIMSGMGGLAYSN